MKESPLSAPVTLPEKFGFAVPYTRDVFAGTTVRGAGVTTNDTLAELLAKSLESVGVRIAFNVYVPADSTDVAVKATGDPPLGE
jgi:hypothetical protein